jgi:N-acyl homoserine lactone hydrolase
MGPEDQIGHRLGELGLTTDDITHVINTHLHFDHCGQNSAFPGIPILVHRRHYEAALVGDAFPNEYFDLPELTYELFDDDAELFKGVTAITTSGHAPYHQSLLIDLPNTGKILLAVDSIFIRDNLEHDNFAAAPDPEAARESAHRVKRMADELGAMLVFGHDPGQWNELKHAPAFYD